MQNSQLIAVLKTFSKKEVREFRKWLLSPFHNQRKDVIDLFEYFQRNDHLEKEHLQAKSRIYPKIFGKEAFDDAKIRQTMHFLQKQIDDYLTYKELTNDDTTCKIALLSQYRKKQLDKHSQKLINTISKIQGNQPYRDANYLWSEYLSQKEAYLFLSEQRQRRTVRLNLQEMVDALDQAYFSNKIKQSCLMQAHKGAFKVEYNEGPIQEVIQYIDQEKHLLEMPAIAAYYYGYMTFRRKDDDSYFYKLKEVIYQSLHLFNKNDARDILLMATSFCIARINIGDQQFARDSFDLYKYGVENEILSQNNTISRWSFMNIVKMGSLIKEEFDWVEKFIENFQDQLEASNRENIVHFCRAKLYYARGDYDRSMQELIQVKENDILLNLSSKHTLLKIYYEKDEFEALDSLIDSMSKYLQRKLVPVSYRKIYGESIVKLMKKLTRINPHNKQDVKNLAVEIEGAGSLPSSEKEWFLKQVENL